MFYGTVVSLAIIEVKNLTKIFDFHTKAVDSVSFKVEKGEIFGFLGPNGAGKTTVIKMMVTLLRPTKGDAIIAGHDIRGDADSVRRSIGIVFQDPALDDELTGRENLDFHARMYGMDKNKRKKRIDGVLELVKLKEKENVFVKNYSGGMRRRLEIARGLMHYPKVLFLDEPTLGLDAQTRRAIWDYIKKLNKDEKITVFLTTHYMEEADYLCDRVAIIDQGKILVIDRPDKLKISIGRDVVNIECNNTEGFAKELKKKKWVESLKLHNSSMTIGVKEGEKKIPKIMKVAEKAKIKVTSISVRKPTLEDVFLHYTGRKIRDHEANSTDQLKRRMRMRRLR